MSRMPWWKSPSSPISCTTSWGWSFDLKEMSNLCTMYISVHFIQTNLLENPLGKIIWFQNFKCTFHTMEKNPISWTTIWRWLFDLAEFWYVPISNSTFCSIYLLWIWEKSHWLPISWTSSLGWSFDSIYKEDHKQSPQCLLVFKSGNLSLVGLKSLCDCDDENLQKTIKCKTSMVVIKKTSNHLNISKFPKVEISLLLQTLDCQLHL